VDLGPLIPEERRFSRVFRGRGELIDHILVSHALVQRVEQVDTGPGEPRSITEDPTERRDEPVSDHLPVVARFAWTQLSGGKRPTHSGRAQSARTAVPGGRNDEAIRTRP
jgi:hypothetical protein